MRKLILGVAIVAGFLTLMLIAASSNGNVVNLLLDGNTAISGGTGSTPAQRANATGAASEDTGVTGSTQSFVSGLEPTNDGSLNLLYLLQNSGELDPDNYAYQLLQAYSDLSAGKFNNFAYHATPDVIAGSHQNETKLGTFLVPEYKLGQENKKPSPLGQSVNGRKVTVSNATKSDIQALGLMKSVNNGQSVWYDSNDDGYPDGPLQVIAGNQGKELANKERGSGSYDLYSFPDSMNFLDKAFNDASKTIIGVGLTPQPAVVSMLSGLDHNRGSGGVVQILFGFPYWEKNVKTSSVFNKTSFDGLSKKQVEAAIKYLQDLNNWFIKSNIPYDELDDDQKVQGIGLLLNLANGGFLDTPLQKNSKKQISDLKDSVIQKIFPGQNNKTIVDYVNSNFVKNPWDQVGMTKGEFKETYGLNADTYEHTFSDRYGYARNTSFYVDKSLTSDIYKGGSNVPVLRAVEGISMGYMLNTSVTGNNVLMNIAKDAGIKSLDAPSVTDPTNPNMIYQNAPKDTYNPVAADGDFDKLLEYFGMTGTLTKAQYGQLSSLYRILGSEYSQAERGSMGPNGVVYTDCSYLAFVGLRMLDSLPKGNATTSTNAIVDGSLLYDKNVTYQGSTYNARVYQLDLKGKPLKDNRKKLDEKLVYKDVNSWSKYLIPGDMLVYRGHIVIFMGQNKTGKTITVPKSIGKLGGESVTYNSTYDPGEYVMIAASGSDKLASIRQMWGGKPYMAIRPAYNIQ